uniref:Vacuolar protein sorting-associated protein 13 DH-like domain-containing protein n=1 Tax=Timema genevievae TaxID=629358 RepID=A0A7R9K2T9_TIMGE|nr:unnamed protein product [Timema genevievae]
MESVYSNTDADSKCSENILGHPTRYISEIVVKLQPVDFVFSPATLESFLTITHPLLLLSGNIEEKVGQTHPPLKKWARRLNNNNLPLLYMDTRSVRLIMPATDLTDVGRIHDVCMIQIDSIALTPQADNPLSRIVVRPDIYHLAEQEHILGVPGSEVEDRQYQLNVLGLCVNTGTWKELDRCLGQNVNSQLSSLTLRTMNENPALEWNNLMCGVESIMPHMTLVPVVQRVDLCVVAAPAIIYKDVLVCGVSFEVNAFTNIQVSVSMNQVLLASALFTELLMLLEPLIADSFYNSNYTLLPMSSLPNQTSDEIEISVTDYNKFADSGIDCADISSMSGEKPSVNQIKDGTTISSINTPKSSGYHADLSSRGKREHPVTLYDTRHHKARANPCVVPVHKVASKESTTNMKRYPKNIPDKPELVPIEILFTASTVSGVLYQVLGTSESNLRELTSLWRQRVKQRITSNPSIFTDESGPYFSSNETSTDELSADDELLTQGKNVQPLLYIFVSQPHSYISRLSQSRKIQISCFDISIRTCIDKSFHCHNTPKLENFPTVLLETKSGEPHQETGIPPSFLTVIWSKGIGKPAKLEIDLGRPTKFHLSVARLNYLEGIVRKILDIYSDSDNILQSAELTFQRKDMNRDVAGSRIDEEKEMFFLHYEVSLDSIERPSFIEKNPNVTIPNGTLSTTHLSSLDLQSDYKNIGDGDQTQSMVQLQHLLWQVSEMSVKTQQIVLSMETTEGFQLANALVVLSQTAEDGEIKVLLSLLDLTCGVSYQSRQVDRVTGNVAVNSLTITTFCKNDPRLLLNPWTFNVNVCLAWEPWCKSEATPQIQVTADSDCILIDVGPEHLRCLHYVWQEYQHLIEYFSLNNSTQYDDTRSKMSDSLPDQEQHYRDDLRAGAFQYLDSTNTSRDELPLPYQVVFWGSPPTMAWRYPQPRALTRVDVFPVPFKLASVDHFARGQRDQVVCSLQYWSECRSSYQHYARFQLSESEMCRLNLPHPPHRVVACTWRVQLFVRSPDDECDDTNAGTDEDILLASKHCHLYSWRTHKVKQLLRVGVEEGSWVWCQPFMIDKDGTEWCPLKECGSKDLNLLIQVVSLSTTQKQIIIAGQLLITNLLVQNLECQVVPIEDESSRLNEGQSLIALGNSTPASILLDNKCKMGLRIRFHRREAAWSSNIPLRENTNHGKPWLVKLPLLDSVQFLRVWCRVICQKLGTHGIKILAMLCPVYMIRSYLPIPAKALIDTPGLNVHLESTVNGKGEEQQLYCPGTIDHSHQLTFQLENGIPPSNPYVPLSYSMLDQHKLKNSSDEDIDIDHVLRSLNDNKSKTWPFLGDVYENVDWISAEQPETHVQVKYGAKDPFCSHGDVKVKVEMRCHTTCVTVETVSHVEISARDIRSRLSFRHADTSKNSVEAAINPLLQQVSHLELDHHLTSSSSEVHVELQQASKSSIDHSPLYLALFERHCVVTTAYKLGNTLALHYLYGAIFGVGWVVGSMELLGNPGGLARTLGTGLRDFVYLPYQGILQGPWGFFVGVTHGSASLMKHITAGTLSSVTNFAASVARNLDRLTLDQEHFHRTEEVRRQRPQGVAQGLLQGLTGLGISLLGAVGGIAHHPLQSMMSEGASPRSLVTGVGRGLVGVITKPLSGAAELVALTGQGLLHGTGWTTLPDVRQEPVIEHTFCGTNSQLKYNWKLVAGLASGRHTLLHVTEATCISPSGIYEPVALVLTTQALFLINTEEDTTQRVLSLSELSGLDHPTDPTLLCFQFQMPPMPMEMDPTSHARVVEFVRRSSGMVNFGNDSNSDAESSHSGSPLLNDVMSFDTPLTFYLANALVVLSLTAEDGEIEVRISVG